MSRPEVPAVKKVDWVKNPIDAFVLSKLEEMGLEIINVSESLGVVEAIDTTFWFGFKDDVVVRVRSEADRSRRSCGD